MLFFFFFFFFLHFYFFNILYYLKVKESKSPRLLFLGRICFWTVSFQVCSICERPGGSCIRCRVVGCDIPFHPWCAHQKVLYFLSIEATLSLKSFLEKIKSYFPCTLLFWNFTMRNNFVYLRTFETVIFWLPLTFILIIPISWLYAPKW